MANTFKNAKLELTDTDSTIYTVPAGTVAIIINSHVTNIAVSNTELTMTWIDSSDSNNSTYIADAIVVPSTAAYEPMGKLVLEAGDSVKGFASANSALDVTLSILEIS